ncbi:MAG TPA: 3-dehydroquinate synthase [Candidatus Binataceae bacterium]|nr:3-dehydroquinate synthase [Candidatus Binataceae bacterium]
MHTFRVELGANAHEVHVGTGLLDKLGALSIRAGLRPGRTVVVSDSNVAALYAERAIESLARAGFQPELIEIAPGEASKSLATVELLYDRMTAAELDRAGAVFALGGGVIGDLAGFAAATYLRAVAIVQVPTTIVAQVDSSLGGKTGVNHPRAKNLIGAFHQPRAIIADVATLASLPEREFREGFAEVIKYGAIMDAAMLADLERDLDLIATRDPTILASVITRSLKHKAAIVAADEREGGLRKILNFGHTLGHALEASAGYGRYLHGEAVAIGMAAAALLSEKYSGLSAAETARLARLIERMGLPAAMPPGTRDDPAFAGAMRLDKKRADGGIEFVLLDRLGHALTRKLDFGQIAAALA